MSGDDDFLYYYCSLGTFLSIVKHGSFWMNDMRKSNDSREIDWAFEGLRSESAIIKGYFEAIEKGNHPSLDECISEARQASPAFVFWDSRSNLGEYSYDRICADDRYLIVAKEVDDAGEVFGGPVPWILRSLCTEARRSVCNRCYALCVSEKRDSLGQWRGYADNGRGVCLTLSKQFFERLYKECGLDYLFFDRIRYGRARFDDFCDAGERFFPNMDTAHRLRRMSPFYKNKSFEEEREWRLLIWLEDHSANVDLQRIYERTSLLKELPQLGFSNRGSDLVPHVEVRPHKLSDVLNEVTLGPRCTAIVEDVQLLLAASEVGDSVNVGVSSSSYR